MYVNISDLGVTELGKRSRTERKESRTHKVTVIGILILVWFVLVWCPPRVSQTPFYTWAASRLEPAGAAAFSRWLKPIRVHWREHLAAWLEPLFLDASRLILQSLHLVPRPMTHVLLVSYCWQCSNICISDKQRILQDGMFPVSTQQITH